MAVASLPAPVPETSSSKAPKASTQPLRCRCGSTAFGAPQPVTLSRDGEKLTATPCDAPGDMTYTCLGCGDTGTLEYLKGRLGG